jgi:antitoxin HigA-1
MMSGIKYVPAPPIGPGEVLRTRILNKNGLTQDKLAKAMDVSRFTLNQIINGHRSVTAETAMRLARVTSTTAKFWLNLQAELDLYELGLKLNKEIEQLEVLQPPKSKAEMFWVETTD